MRPALCIAALLAASAGVQAQPIYRIVGPDGKVTFSDRPAATVADKAPAGSATVVESQANGSGIDTALLPYELREVAQRYPVTLYTTGNCAPCGEARAALRGRGVPFVEKTVGTAADAEAFTRISGSTNLPFATIGSQQLQGYSSTEWAQYLDLAGYPKQSSLPATYRAPAASPLVAVTQARPQAATPAATARSAAPAAPAKNPAGIQF